jgi:ribonuclease HI
MSPEVVIYCDGACSPNPGVGGWGAVLLTSAPNPLRKEISGAEADSTNNRMEITAALRALEALKRPCRVTVFTDSTYVMNAFDKGWLARWKTNGWKTREKKPVLNVDLWQALDEIRSLHEVTWRWVAGHADNAENNRADALAVAAREALALRLNGRTRR